MKMLTTLQLIHEQPKHRNILPIQVNLITQYELESMGWYTIDFLLEEAPIYILYTHKQLKLDVLPIDKLHLYKVTDLGAVADIISLAANAYYDFTPTQLDINVLGITNGLLITEPQMEQLKI